MRALRRAAWLSVAAVGLMILARLLKVFEDTSF